MGLDAILYKAYEEERDKHVDLASFIDSTEVINEDELKDLVYWRKINCIQGFMEDTVGDCIGAKYISLRRSDLKNILDIAQDELTYLEAMDQTVEPFEDTDKSAAFAEEHVGELFPPKVGFFYGPDCRNEYHLANVKEAIETLTKVIEKSDDKDLFMYHCSW